ncbi:TetR/AcrR family transcriptional regulator [Ponticoccus alexandrii]|uniref:TetR family transcriptional regulator n=1 Tax=Ponticoccus alexandrii TaxID=1943633 RepID=A0ABX7F7D8_9RHOB|nr:TetR/AcrR family transcriptional regulator [Ponticoccus alexandrii]ETA50816.1 TetR family transcriptional regulator [Rhodobacteraceae bacterium PD-2]QRF66160.1 TetR family transcriptional regulator [Ponticoccus alexandrii]
MARTIAKDHDDKREAILKGAARLFADEGYGRASMAQVAQACGISKANIYHYYNSKEALLFDILDAHLSGLRDQIAGLRHVSDDPERQLRTITREILVAYKGREAEHGVQLNAIRALPGDQQAVLIAYQRDLVAEVRDRLARLAPPALAADRSAMRALTMSYFAMVNWHFQWDDQADEAGRADYAEMICDLLLGGMPQVGR